MAHFGIFCPPIPGHLNPLAAVGRVLVRRGHRVTVFHLRDLEPKVHAQGLQFVAIGGDHHFPPGTLQECVEKLSGLQELGSLRFAIRCARTIAEAILQDGPRAVSLAGIDVLLVDQNEPAGASVAEHLQLPFVSTCTSLPLNREASIPPPFIGWPYATSVWGQARNLACYFISDCFIAGIQNTLNTYRQRWGLPLLRTPDDSFSPTAQISQMGAAFEFPRKRPIANMFHLGPWFDDDEAPEIPFPFERLDGRSVIYGSLGTLQEAQNHLFHLMAEACVGLPAQLVLSLGKPEADSQPELPGRPVVVGYAPQVALLRHAAVTITHGGMNTTQQSLAFGVPLVAIPLTHDQPGIAARLARTGAGLVIPPKQVTAERLREALREVLPEDSTFRNAAQRLEVEYRRAGGAESAADIAESHIPGQVVGLGISEQSIAQLR